MAQLIMVEGIPGSGKSITAQFIKKYLEKNAEPVALYLEGDLDHPADLEQVAALTDQEFKDLGQTFPEWHRFLHENAISQSGFHLFPYGKWQVEKYTKLPQELLAALQEYDTYDGKRSAADYQLLLRNKWENFADFNGRASGVIIFECCFLQNPFCALKARFDLSEQEIEKHILSLDEAIEGLNPLLIYLDARNTRQTLEKVGEERSKKWLDFVIDYHHRQGYGKAQKLEGFDGLVSFMEARQKIERKIIRRLSMPVLSIDLSSGNWEKHHEIITDFLDQTIK